MTETNKTRKVAEHPSYETMIAAAISHLKERKGSSRPALKKYILANYKVSPGAHFDSQINHAIRRGVTKNTFSLPKGNSGTIKLVKPEKKPSLLHADKKPDEKKVTETKLTEKKSPVHKKTPKKSDEKKPAQKKTMSPKKVTSKKTAATKKLPTKRTSKRQVPKATIGSTQAVAVA
ncbi:linker histone H1 and H5 family-domain-containing protein [Choanephora cucurbitarum]|nr:linker histone H1 and H5 family-domain-containing protein [Choanephora cucurbitarum]